MSLSPAPAWPGSPPPTGSRGPAPGSRWSSAPARCARAARPSTCAATRWGSPSGWASWKRGRQRVPLGDGPGPVWDASGVHIANIDLTWFANETDDDIEIDRTRLNDLLLSAVPPGVDFRYGTWAVAIDDGSR